MLSQEMRWAAQRIRDELDKLDPSERVELVEFILAGYCRRCLNNRFHDEFEFECECCACYISDDYDPNDE